MFWSKPRDTAVTRSLVREDWRTLLPSEKKCVFDSMVRQWEDAYNIFSVALDEAMSLRADGKLIRARHCAEIASATIADLTDPLAVTCRALARTGRHLSSPPAVAPLNPAFYRGEAARQNAHWNLLMHRVFFSGRARFLHKLRVLEITVASLADAFHRACEDLLAGSRPDASWRRLDELHYDVNTCLRELVVVLKSFLLALPAQSLAAFQNEWTASILSARQAPRPSQAPAIVARRAGLFRRE